MAKLEFGLRAGLGAQPLVHDRSGELFQSLALKKQASIEAENKAKLFADDFAYNNAVNSFDNPIINEVSRRIIRKAGTWMRNNPGWERDPIKRIEFNEIRREIKDHPDLRRGLASDKSLDTFAKYLADPKNADMRDDPEILKLMQQRDNYEKYGNQFGEEAAKKDGLKPFMFVAPEDLVDTTKYLVDLAGKTQYDMRNGFGRGGYRQSVSNDRRNLQVKSALNDSYWGKMLRKDYDKYLRNNGDKNKTIETFVRERMEPVFPADKIDTGFAPETIKAPAKMTHNLWVTMHDRILNSPGMQGDLNPKAIDATFSNAVGEKNLSGVKDPFGNTLNLGLRKADATGIVNVHKTGDGGMYAEYDALVRLPLKEFRELGSEYEKAIDELGIGQIFPGEPSKENWDIHNEYRDLGFKRYEDSKGNAFVEFPIKQKYNPLNESMIDNYTNAHNVSPHKEDIYNTGEQPKTVVQNGYTYTWNEATQQYE